MCNHVISINTRNPFNLFACRGFFYDSFTILPGRIFICARRPSFDFQLAICIRLLLGILDIALTPLSSLFFILELFPGGLEHSSRPRFHYRGFMDSWCFYFQSFEIIHFRTVWHFRPVLTDSFTTHLHRIYFADSCRLNESLKLISNSFQWAFPGFFRDFRRFSRHSLVIL